MAVIPSDSVNIFGGSGTKWHAGLLIGETKEKAEQHEGLLYQIGDAVLTSKSTITSEIF